MNKPEPQPANQSECPPTCLASDAGRQHSTSLNSVFRIASVLFLVTMGVAMGSVQANAGIFYRLDVNSVEDGVQSMLGATTGDVVTADVVIVLDEATTLGNYQISLTYDQNELMFESGTETLPPDFSSISLITNTTPGVVNGIESGTFGAGLGAGTYTVATITFRVLTPTGDQSDVDLMFFEDGVFDGSFGGDFSTLTPTFAGASITDVTAVPEPSSLAIVGMLICAFTFRRRR